MTFVLALLLLQEKFPAEDHAWLRFKTGSWIRSRITIHDGDRTDQGLQTLTLVERNGDKYTIEEASTLSQGGKSINRTSLPVKTGAGQVRVEGQDIACAIWTAKGERDDRPTETRYWIPVGRKDPVRMTFQQDGVEGDLTAVSRKEPVKIGERTYSCVKLQGTVTTVRGKGTATIWTTHEIPSGQVRLELVLDTTGGKVKFRVEAAQIHEEN